jgi:hypothetical protein
MVTIKFSTANEAFDVPGLEIARILHALANRIDSNWTLGGLEYKIQDANGNTVGSFKYTEE